MKKIILLALILCGLFLPQWVSAQTEGDVNLKAQQQVTFKNQFDLDIHYLALEATYKRRLYKNLFIGGSFHFGSALGWLYYDKRFSAFGDMIYGKVLLDYAFSKKFHMHIGALYGLNYFEYYFDIDFFKGLEVGLFYKIWRLEIGFQPKLGYASANDNLLYLFPIIHIKIPIVRW